jgi:hypothetical protein
MRIRIRSRIVTRIILETRLRAKTTTQRVGTMRRAGWNALGESVLVLVVLVDEERCVDIVGWVAEQ